MTEKRIDLSLSDIAMSKLEERALDNLANGGRGIGNIVESLLINPLSRYIFDENIQSNMKITIDDIDTEKIPYALTCTYGEIV